MKEYGNLLARITVSLVLLAFLITSGRDASASLPQKPHKRILLLYGLDRMHPAHEMAETGILSVVTSDPAFDIELFPEYMDLSRFQGRGLWRYRPDGTRPEAGASADCSGGGASDLDKISLEIVRNKLKQYQPEMAVLDITGLAMPRIIERVGSLLRSKRIEPTV